MQEDISPVDIVCAEKFIDEMYDEGYRRGTFDKHNGRPKADLSNSALVESWVWGYQDAWGE